MLELVRSDCAIAPRLSTRRCWSATGQGESHPGLRSLAKGWSSCTQREAPAKPRSALWWHCWPSMDRSHGFWWCLKVWEVIRPAAGLSLQSCRIPRKYCAFLFFFQLWIITIACVPPPPISTTELENKLYSQNNTCRWTKRRDCCQIELHLLNLLYLLPEIAQSYNSRSYLTYLIRIVSI